MILVDKDHEFELALVGLMGFFKYLGRTIWRESNDSEIHSKMDDQVDRVERV